MDRKKELESNFDFSKLKMKENTDELSITYDNTDVLKKASDVTIAELSKVTYTGKYKTIKDVEQVLEDRYDYYKDEIDLQYYYKDNVEDTNYKFFSLDEDLNRVKKTIESVLHAPVNECIIKENIINYNTPVRNHLKECLEIAAVSWDGKDRIKALCSSVKLDDDNTFIKIFTKWYCNMLHQVYTKNFANEVVLVFQGEQQGDGKTYWFENLLPVELTERYLDVMENFNPGDKDNLHKMCSKMLIVLDEMSAYERSDIKTLKATISKKTFDIRLSYRKDRSTYKRYCSFAGTVNDAKFLRDFTGDRRYAVFSILEPVNGIIYNTVDKYQLLCQMMNQYKNHFEKWDKADFQYFINKNRSDYTVESEAEEILTKHIIADNNNKYSFNEVKRFFFSNMNRDLKLTQNTFGALMRKMGIQHKRTTLKNGQKITMYYLRIVIGGVSEL